MAQQTPLSRVEPAWREWLARWPTPAALAADVPGEAVRAWGRLGYPRRALRLHAAAVAMVERHDGRVPQTVAALRALPGVGEYTAAAVACFAYGIPQPVVDTNVRRVLARLLTGTEHAAASMTAAERTLAAAAMPHDRSAAADLERRRHGARGAGVHRPQPALRRVPGHVTVRVASRRAPTACRPARRGQPWAGTDRQVRGALVQALRESPVAVAATSSRGCARHHPSATAA